MDCGPPGSSVHGDSLGRILEWVSMPSSRGSSQPRHQIRVSCIAGRFFTSWATREAHVTDDSTKNSKRIWYLFFSNYCKTLKKRKHLLTHLVRPASPKGWYQRQSTKMKIIGEYLLWHLTRWLSEFKHQCKR